MGDTAMGERYAVRSAERPMAFTGWEFVRGAVLAWVSFLVVAPAVQLVGSLVPNLMSRPDGVQAVLGSLGLLLLMGVWLAISMVLPWSFGALLMLGAPLGFALGLALRRVRDRRVHVVAFALLGAVVGLVTTLVFIAVGSWDAAFTDITTAVLVNTIVCAACATWGWWFTASRALRADAAGRVANEATAPL